MKSEIKFCLPSSAICPLSSVFRPLSSIVPRLPALHSPQGVGGSSIVYFAALVLFVCACPASGIFLNDGLMHDIDYIVNDDIYVDGGTPEMYTTVNVLDGGRIEEPYMFAGYEDSRINILGGSVDWLGSFDSSQLNVSGGSIVYLQGVGSSKVNISGGAINSVVSSDSSQVNVSGGSMHSLGVNLSSQVNITGGSMDFVQCGGTSKTDIFAGSIDIAVLGVEFGQVNIYGGLIRDIQTQHYSQVNVYGGTIACRNLVAFEQSVVQIFGYDFAVDGQPVDYGLIRSVYGGYHWNEPDRYLTGTLLNGGYIDNNFLIGQDALIVLSIPEPASVILLGLGLLFLKEKKR